MAANRSLVVFGFTRDTQEFPGIKKALATNKKDRKPS